MSCRFLAANVQISCKFLAKPPHALLGSTPMCCRSHDYLALRHQDLPAARAPHGSAPAPTAQE
jgi:hypothetical protein